jgi:porphobilinogen synthase
MYGPFRVAAGGSPKFGNRKTYQMNYANSNEALIEAELDVKEGADILMVKPAHTYLDIIYKIKSANKSIPLAAFHTSGEYAMITSAHSLGTLDFNEAIVEVTAAIKRSGADLIITYAAKTLAKLIIKN